MTENELLFEDLEKYYRNYIRAKIMNEAEMVRKGLRTIGERIQILQKNMKKYISYQEKQYLIDELEKYYKLYDEYSKKYTNLMKDINNIYICCSNDVRVFLLKMGSILKEAMPSIQMSDIYNGLILVAYSMLSEQYYDMIKIVNMTEDTKKVFFGITTGDIIYNNENLSSQIRRFFILNEEINPTRSMVDMADSMILLKDSLSDSKTILSEKKDTPILKEEEEKIRVIREVEPKTPRISRKRPHRSHRLSSSPKIHKKHKTTQYGGKMKLRKRKTKKRI